MKEHDCCVSTAVMYVDLIHLIGSRLEFHPLIYIFSYNCTHTHTHTAASLTELALQVAVLVMFDIFVLAEEVLVNVTSSEQPHVRVVCDGPVRVVGPIERRTLSLGLHRSHQIWDAEQPQQLLVSNGHYSQSTIRQCRAFSVSELAFRGLGLIMS